MAGTIIALRARFIDEAQFSRNRDTQHRAACANDLLRQDQRGGHVSIDWKSLNDVMSMAATIAFAATAVLAIRRKSDIDIVSATVLGVITAIGGGTIRDLILDVPVFWSTKLSYVWVATGTSIATLYGRPIFSERYVYSLMLYLDGLGAAMFAIQAASMTWDLGFALPVGPVIMGVITAIWGGLMRDTLAGHTNLLMSREIYATPVLLGCTAFVLVLEYFPNHRFLGSLACIFGTFAFRAAAIYFDLSMPWFTRVK